jgi:hypothetical protein
MGLFSFKSEFEITVKCPKEEAFSRFYSYLSTKQCFEISDSEENEMIVFTRGMSLFSYPIDFVINFIEVDEKQTMLKVKSVSGTIDFGKAKGMINDIINEMY